MVECNGCTHPQGTFVAGAVAGGAAVWLLLDDMRLPLGLTAAT